ncbi:MAG: M28 family peptidase [Bacteroidetes bacterium]|nr:M28 family peptidase [Bacteroidota bacterium]
MLRRTLLFSFATVLLALPAPSQTSYDSGEMLVDAFELSSDAYQGRRIGTEGNAAARAFIVRSLRKSGLDSLDGSFLQDFSVEGDRSATGKGVNVVGIVPGSSLPDRYIVISAHYDHLGVRDGQIFNGADDNASGTAAVLALAKYFSMVNRPHHSILFALFDGEEAGLLGAKAFVSSPPVPLDHIVVDINLDMVSRSEAGELYVSGTRHYPFLREPVARAAEAANERGSGAVKILFGHDEPGTGHDDWTMASDHGPFHRAGIPFIYFGVEDHPGYHQPSDDFADITPRFYINAVEVILQSVLELDASIESVRAGGN